MSEHFRFYIGIDPGLSGGVTALFNDAAPALIPMPVAGGAIDAAELACWLTSYKYVSKRAIAVVEKAQSMPGQGVSSTFNYGVGYGQVLGVLAALRIRTELVRPTEWKKAILAGTDKDKAAAIAYVRRAFPNVSLLATPRCKKPHDGMADSLCIAEYGRRRYSFASDDH